MQMVDERKGATVFAARASYRICSRCIMDSSDPEIRFDDEGICNHCRVYDAAVAANVFRGEDGLRRRARVVERIKRDGRGRRYDCIVGLSGGVDSSYTAWLSRQLGLRPLAVHLDNGWNSELAVKNIENIVRVLGIDLHTVVLDWEQFSRLQLAFLRASTPDSEIPTDHAIIATLYRAASENGVKWILDGSNMVTELMIPPTWSHGHSDWGYIRHVNDRFEGGDLKDFPHYSYFDMRVTYPLIRRIRRFPILNYSDFDRDAVIALLERELGWRAYGGKHYESVYTRFYQGYILPVKFGFDKRRSHLSCLVNSGALTRTQALAEIQQPPLPEQMVEEDRIFLAKKFRISLEEFDRIMNLPRKTFWDYPSDERRLPHTLRWRAFGLLVHGSEIAAAIWRRLKRELGATAS